MDDLEPYESLEELSEIELESEEITENDDYTLDDQEEVYSLEDEPSSEVKLTSPKKTRRKKIVIPPEAHPLEAFMIAKEFEWGHLTGITKLSKEELLGIIRGDVPTEYQKKRIRLTTGVKL